MFSLLCYFSLIVGFCGCILQQLNCLGFTDLQQFYTVFLSRPSLKFSDATFYFYFLDDPGGLRISSVITRGTNSIFEVKHTFK